MERRHQDRGRLRRNTSSYSSNHYSNSKYKHTSGTHVSSWSNRRRPTTYDSVEEKLTTDDAEREEGTSNSLQGLIGTCPFMCPGDLFLKIPRSEYMVCCYCPCVDFHRKVKGICSCVKIDVVLIVIESERAQRESLRDLAVFERLEGNPGKTSPSLAVKKFCRTISTKDVRASDVRPLPVLEETLTYLLNLLDSTDHGFELVHAFIFDRTRSIRQDLVMQNIVDDRAIDMYEKMVKFHVLSQLKLRRCGCGPDMVSLLHLNMEQLTKSLTSLYDLYDASRDCNSLYRNEAEFRSLYVLLHLNPTSHPVRESLSLWLQHVPLSVIQSKEMHFARTILRFLRLGNFKRFFDTIVGEASYMQYCVIEPYISEVRALFLSCINNAGYKLHPYPLTHVSKLLRMKESEVERLCNVCGLLITDEMGTKLLPTKQTTFCYPKDGFQNYNFLGLEQFET
ncbi:hypothetical protein K2173_019166 [Erythroxylum novogranatense]|uniref:SAC3/GANP/THP3 conserved domain-containing protein n=1 Tax=Erythroxylum novogranatense TaxID=1862640 RepID=A0AAV8ST08_9ROSI|nr:hypothetical protein K2173_019166 [Erythroxylum novogranatense]